MHFICRTARIIYEICLMISRKMNFLFATHTSTPHLNTSIFFAFFRITKRNFERYLNDEDVFLSVMIMAAFFLFVLGWWKLFTEFCCLLKFVCSANASIVDSIVNHWCFISAALAAVVIISRRLFSPSRILNGSFHYHYHFVFVLCLNVFFNISIEM